MEPITITAMAATSPSRLTMCFQDMEAWIVSVVSPFAPIKSATDMPSS